MDTADYAIDVGIMKRYNDESAESETLKAAVDGFSNVSSTASDNYVTFRLISDTHNRTFNTKLENCLYQFDVFSTSLLKAKQIAGLIMDVYDDHGITVGDDYTLIHLTRQINRYINKEEDTGLHHYYIEYRIEVEN